MLVSIIVPIFNAEKFLHTCIESVIGQSYREIELVLIEDGSTDTSKSICEQYTFTDNRVKLFSQKNQGPAAARNNGVKQAQGEYIFFLDADDFIDKNSIKILSDAARQHRPDLVMGNFSKQENNNRIIPQEVTFKIGAKPFTDPLKMLTRTDINNYLKHFLQYPSNHLISYCWARLYKTAIIKDNNIFANEEMHLFEDLIFNLEYLKHAQTTIFINQGIYNYVMHNSHISASMAIFNANSLIRDMTIFHDKVNEFMQNTPSRTTTSAPKDLTLENITPKKIDPKIGHALIHYAIIFIIRACRQVNRENRKLIHSEISTLINAPLLQDCLNHYQPTKNNSRLLPLLMKTRQTNLIILLSNYKARKRYGNLSKKE